MKVPGKPLENPKYEIFCRHYAIHANKSEAARVAGYSEASRGQQGYRMSKRDQIKARVEEIRSWSLKNSDLSDEDILTHVADLALNAERPADQIQASKLMLQNRGIAQPKGEVDKNMPPIGTLKQYVISVTHNHGDQKPEPVTIEHEPDPIADMLDRGHE